MKAYREENEWEFSSSAAWAADVGITALVPAGLATSVNSTSYTPNPASLASEFVFQWTTVTGSGQIRYFQVAEAVVPR